MSPTPQDFEKLAESRREAQAAGERIEAIRRNAGLSSSAEPAPPTKKCSECQTSLNEGEGKCFTVCDQCWDKTYRTISGAEKSSALPVQEEATPTLDAATAIRVLTAVAEMYDGKAKHNDGQLSKARDGRLLSEVQREIADVAASVASALPALLEARRRYELLAQSLNDDEGTCSPACNKFGHAHDCESGKAATIITNLQQQLSGSISERETLTARNEGLEAERDAWLEQIKDATLIRDTTVDRNILLDRELRELRAAVARLTTERDKFQDWFQNAEQARAVAEAKLASRSVTRCQKCGAEALPSPTHALDLEAERDEARADVERLTCEKAQLATQLQQSQHVREQAIHDIEALPRYNPLVPLNAILERRTMPIFGMLDYPDGRFLDRDAVLLILREAPTNG